MSRDKDEGDYYESLKYFDFFNRFRNASDIVKQHQSPFLKYFEGCRRVVSLGCGRGEFIEALGERNIGAFGIDVDEEMVDYCKKRGLEVYKADAAEYLRQMDDGSIDGIFTDDFAEHLDTSYLIKLLRLCARKLEKGRYMVNVTVNPCSWAAYSGIYLLDPTHKRPIHPESMRFYMLSAGFGDVDVELITFRDNHSRLKKVEVRPDMDADARRIAEAFNHNVDMLNEVVFGPENYAAIGKK
ncbi:MAG TPA: methyltransferase domain-containing protein [Methanocella sp.]|uniref:class I SAM-dependent methyltransferase n=1 Tax=Methanocella sp. TaxID=2052833 RepID=UPI002C117711|nr:methyltransferase domain-containing protein [Methanocella sp.]HTY91533.1 methyltransferase domain-containing protein [Methanocella sp.]